MLPDGKEMIKFVKWQMNPERTVSFVEYRADDRLDPDEVHLITRVSGQFLQK